MADTHPVIWRQEYIFSPGSSYFKKTNKTYIYNMFVSILSRESVLLAHPGVDGFSIHNRSLLSSNVDFKFNSKLRFFYEVIKLLVKWSPVVVWSATTFNAVVMETRIVICPLVSLANLPAGVSESDPCHGLTDGQTVS